MSTEVFTPGAEARQDAPQVTEVETPEFSPLFNYLANPPEGIEDIEAFVYDKYVSQKMTETFQVHGYPLPEEYLAVTRTLRAVYGGQFSTEKLAWEKMREKNTSSELNQSNSNK